MDYKLNGILGVLTQQQPQGILGLPPNALNNVAPVTANQNMLAQATRARQVNPRPEIDPFTLGAGLFGLVPGIGDAMGLAADVHKYATDPSSRTLLNYGLSAAGALPVVPNMAAFKRPVVSETADAVQQRMSRVRNIEDDYRLPNLRKAVPESYLPEATKLGLKEVTVYRAVPKDAGDELRPGDWVTLDKKYAHSHGGGKVIEMKVPADHVGWAGTDMNEFFYVPR
jgi:hypothetical protein